MAHVEAGKTHKGKNFSAEEERSLCRRFLVVLYDPICGNGQRNFTFGIVSLVISITANHAQIPCVHLGRWRQNGITLSTTWPNSVAHTSKCLIVESLARPLTM